MTKRFTRRNARFQDAQPVQYMVRPAVFLGLKASFNTVVYKQVITKHGIGRQAHHVLGMGRSPRCGQAPMSRWLPASREGGRVIELCRVMVLRGKGVRRWGQVGRELTSQTRGQYLDVNCRPLEASTIKDERDKYFACRWWKPISKKHRTMGR